MAKYFEVDFRKGSFADQTGQRTYTISGSPSLIRDAKGLHYNINSTSSYINYSSQVLPDNAFTVVSYVRINKRNTAGYRVVSLISSNANNQVGIHIEEGGSYGRVIQLNTNATNCAGTNALNIYSDNKWHCLIFTMPGSAQSDINSVKCYLDNVEISLSTGLVSSGTPVARSVMTRVCNMYQIVSQKQSGAYLATYDHVFTEQERVKAYNDFLNSYPIEKPSFDYQASKPTDLSKEVNNTLGVELITNSGFDSDTLAHVYFFEPSRNKKSISSLSCNVYPSEKEVFSSLGFHL